MNSLTHSSKTQSRQTCVAKLIHHLLGAWDLRISTTAVSQLQQGSSEGPSCRARQESAPPHPPSLLRPLLQNVWFRHCFRFGEAGKKTPGLPPHQPRPPTALFGEDRRVLDTFSPCGASSKTAPSMLAAWGLGEPSQSNGDTSVSTASCAPPQSGKPSAKVTDVGHEDQEPRCRSHVALRWSPL